MPKKTMRLPNGYGTVRKMSGRRRKPYAAMVNPRLVINTETNKSYYTYDFLDSFRTRAEAMDAIFKYKEAPYNVDNDITLKELYEKWEPMYFEEKKLSKVRQTSIKATWAYCTPLYNQKVRDITSGMLKEHIKSAHKIGTKGSEKGKKVKASPIIMNNIKSLYNMLFDYALLLNIVHTNCSRNFTFSKPEIASREGNPFTDHELDILWGHVNDPDSYADMILVQCYSGWRPDELITIKMDNVNMDKRTYTNGSKTEAGLSREVPIHSKIFELVNCYYQYAQSINSPYLFNLKTECRGSRTFNYQKYKYRFDTLMKELNIQNHTPHDARHTFSTLAKRYKVDEYARKRIMGHSIEDFTDRVYTHLDIEWFRDELEKIK